VNPTLLVSWFPIILAVGIGGRMLDRRRATGLGVLCTFFWVILLQACHGPEVWMGAMRALSILAGSGAILAMGAWAGEMSLPSATLKTPGHSPIGPVGSGDGRQDSEALGSFSSMLDRFDTWLEQHQGDIDPWPKFDEFIRTVLYESCAATHVKPFHVLCEGDELSPLRGIDPFEDVPRVSARRGIIGDVIATGRSYVAGTRPSGESTPYPAREAGEELLTWCFPIMQGTRGIGVVMIGQLGIAPDSNEHRLHAAERMVALFWRMLCETCRSRTASMNDPASALFTRETFLRVSDETLQNSYGQGEPVALAVIALEQLRHLNDTARWDVADELVREVSILLKDRVRTDDHVGRFDGSRFLILLRRVDLSLATLILEQLLTRLQDLVGDNSRWRISMGVRCGVTCSGKEQPDMHSLISQAIAQCHKARVEDKAVCGDLYPAAAVSETVS